MVEGWIISILASVAAGFLVKLADDYSEAGATNTVAYAYAILYGAAIGAVCYFYPPMLTLWLAALAGVIIAGKIDNSVHLVGVAVAGVSLFLIPVSTLMGNFWLAYAIPFFLASFADERFHESDNKLLRTIASKRLFLDIAAVLVTAHYALVYIPSNGDVAVIGDYMFAITLFCFDIAYLLASLVSKRIISRPPPQPKKEEQAPVQAQSSEVTSLPA